MNNSEDLLSLESTSKTTTRSSRPDSLARCTLSTGLSWASDCSIIFSLAVLNGLPCQLSSFSTRASLDRRARFCMTDEAARRRCSIGLISHRCRRADSVVSSLVAASAFCPSHRSGSALWSAGRTQPSPLIRLEFIATAMVNFSPFCVTDDRALPLPSQATQDSWLSRDARLHRLCAADRACDVPGFHLPEVAQA